MNVELADEASHRRETGWLVLLVVVLAIALGPLAYAGLVEGEVRVGTRIGAVHFTGAHAALAGGLLLAFVLLPVAWIFGRSRWRRHIVFAVFASVAALDGLRVGQLSS